jgi:hypothetical protein
MNAALTHKKRKAVLKWSIDSVSLTDTQATALLM